MQTKINNQKSNMEILSIIIIGLFGGILSGAVGVGGGLVLVPCMVYFLGFNQHLAQGTTLALLAMPVVALSVYKYYQNGNVDFTTAFLLGIGFVFGGYIGAVIANSIDAAIVKKIFSIVMILVGIKMFLGK